MKNKHAKEPFHGTHVEITTFLAIVQTRFSLASSAKAEKILCFYQNIIIILEENVFSFLCVENNLYLI